MSQTETVDSPTLQSVEEPLQRLLSWEPTTLPVISLYLNTQADARGRDQYEGFLRKELATRVKTWETGTEERKSLDADIERIHAWLENELAPSANGVALFACSGAGLWEAVQLNVPLDGHRLYIYNQPHLYHLTRLDDEYPRYAALLTDANSARIFVFGLGQTIDTEQVKGKKVHRVKVGGWSQARYQRRVENAHQSHAKEVVEVLDRLVREEGIKHILLTGEPQMMTVLQGEMPKHLADKVVDVLRLDLKSSDQEVFETTLQRMREEDARSDADKVERMMVQYRARGLACVGPEDTLAALANGQVDEVLISANLEQEHAEPESVEAVLAPEIPDSEGGTESDEPRQVLLADLLVTRAGQTDAHVTFIEDPELLSEVGGVGAFLRWR
ncbi:MAG: VLRF1 family aeRF1-type release factor [Bryobacteraceae bacterium]|nr:VLRF1 family aeRF1-type release factor [Bryobacteraceae bacterium]